MQKRENAGRLSAIVEAGSETKEQKRLFKTWAISEYLSLDEAAALALGVDPHDDSDRKGRERIKNLLSAWILTIRNRAMADIATEDNWGRHFEFRDQVIERKGGKVFYLRRDSLLEYFDKEGLRPAFLYPEGSKPTTRGESGRERRVLYLIIAALLGSLDIDPRERNATSRVERILHLQGVKMNGNTIRKHIREAFETLEEEKNEN